MACRPIGLSLLVLVLIAVAGCAKAGPVSSPPSAPATEPSPARPAMAPATSDIAPRSTAAPARSPSISTSPQAAPTEPPSTATLVIPSPAPTEAPSPDPTAPLEVPRLEQVRLRLEPVAGGLDRPVFVTHAGDGSGRLFIVEKGGTIRVVQQGQLVPRPFLDIRDRVLSRGSEQGLLGLAFSPDYHRTGTFFVDYIDRSGNTVISRFRVTGDPNVADPTSESKVLGINQPAANHNGGDLVFGPDGRLWIGTGDGGGANDRYGNGQNPKTLLGKMLRLDVTSDPSKPYAIPPDNPWVNAQWNGQDIRAEIWAVGLRNPWRYSFDRGTGDLWIADVGQDKYEEIDRVPAGPGGKPQGGLNFGWPIMEGTHCFPDNAVCPRDGLTLPVFDYPHGANGCSITGGYVYRGKAIAGLDGAYLYGDYCSGRIWALTQSASGAWNSRLLLESGLAISSFGEDEAGEIYVADLAGGAVYRLAAQ
jgi:glucose/arabinose dehydrogenase/predicted small lipoprotein YifL